VGGCRDALIQRPLRHRELFSKIDGVVWSNPFIKNIFHNNGLKCDFEYTIPFPIPESAKKIFSIPLANTKDKINVAFIGTLRHSKGPQVLIKAAKKLSKDNFQFYFWGASEKQTFENTLLELAKDQENISFCGTFAQKDFHKVLEEIHVVVVPSLWYENTPLTALSVLASKRILMVSDLGGLSSLVENNKTGFTFEPNNHDHLAELLQSIYDDKTIVSRISRNIPKPDLIDSYTERLIREVWKIEIEGESK
jgi:glycosyltransferase involved in cell wall biosynthesis